jgi:tryptophan-rich hypothetical protein
MARRDPRGTADPESPAGAPAPAAAVRKNPLSPKKLLLTKWTAVAPINREKHFMVVRVIEPEPPEVRIDQVELEAVHSRRLTLLNWRELTDGRSWRQGWV